MVNCPRLNYQTTMRKAVEPEKPTTKTMKFKLATIITFAAALMLTSCGVYQNPNASAAQKDAIAGGAIGSIAGYYLGKQSNRRGEGAALGGILGAGLGYMVGKNKDQQWNQYNQQQPQQQTQPTYNAYPNTGGYYK